METKLDEVDGKVLDKIKALFELSKSPNEGEASNAAQAAMRLLAKYNLSQEEFSLYDGRQEEIESEDFENKNRSLSSWKVELLAACASANFSHMYTHRGWRSKSYCVVTGTPTNKQACKMLYVYLESMVEHESKQALKNYRGWEHGKTYSYSFRMGMVERIAERLLDQKRQIIAEASRALVVYDPYALAQERIDAFYEQQHLKLVSGPGYSLAGSKAGYSAGRDAGAKVALNGSSALPMRGS